MKTIEEVTWADFPESDEELVRLAVRTPGLVRVFRAIPDGRGGRTVRRRYFFAGYAQLGDCSSIVQSFVLAVGHHLTRAT